MNHTINQAAFRRSMSIGNAIYQKIKDIKTLHDFANCRFRLIKDGLAISLHNDAFDGYIAISEENHCLKVAFADKNKRGLARQFINPLERRLRQ